MPKLSKGNIKNILVLMKFSGNEKVRHYATVCDWYVEKLLEHIQLSYEVIEQLCSGSEIETETVCAEIFRNGWLSPDGDFTVVPYAMHEQTVLKITGYKDRDTAQEHDWVRLTFGHPHNYEVNYLFEAGENKTRFTPAQVTWLNQWLTQLAGEEVTLIL